MNTTLKPHITHISLKYTSLQLQLIKSVYFFPRFSINVTSLKGEVKEGGGGG